MPLLHVKINQLGKCAPVQKYLLHNYLKGKEMHMVKVPIRGAGAGQGAGVGAGVRVRVGAGTGVIVRVKGGKGGHQPENYRQVLGSPKVF